MMVIIQPADQLPHVELVDGDDPPHSWDQSDQWSVWSVWLKFQYDHWSLISDVAWSVWQHFSKDSMIDSNSLSFQVKKVDMRRDHVHQYHHRVSENKSYSYESLSSQNSFSLEKLSVSEKWGGNLPEQGPSADQDDDHDHNGENWIQVIPEQLTIGAGKLEILIQ